MKYFIIFFVIGYFAIAQDNSILVSVSPRIGDTLDKYEVVYFGMFKDLKNVESAQFFKNDEETFNIKVKYLVENVEKDTTILITKDFFKKITYYIENFEKLFSSTNDTNLKDPLLWELFKQKQRYFPNEIKWIDFQEAQFRHQFLYLDSSFIVVWLSDSLYDWRKLDDNIQIIFYNQIFELSGFEIVGNLNYYRQSLPEITNKLSFIDYYNDSTYHPKELLDYIDKNKARFMGPPKIDSKRTWLYKPIFEKEYTNYIIAGFEYNQLDYNANTEVLLITGPDATKEEKREQFKVEFPTISRTYFAEVSLYLLPLYIYGNYTTFQKLDVNKNADFFVNGISKGIGLKYRFEYVLMSKSRYLSYFNNKKIGLNLSSGAILNQIDIEMNLRKKYQNSDYKANNGYPYSNNNVFEEFGYNYALSADFTILKGLYISAKMQWNVIPEATKFNFFNPLQWESYIGRKYMQREISNVNSSHYALTFGISYGLDTFFYYF
jgi:hypothetical protein